MEGIHRGEIEAATALDDSAAYRALARFLVAAIAASSTTPSGGTTTSPAPSPR